MRAPIARLNVPRGLGGSKPQNVPNQSFCLHCHQDLSPTQIRHGVTFCCAGCDAVYQLIHSSGLSAYYDLSAGSRAPARPGTGPISAELDHAVSNHQASDGSLARLTVDIQGVHCAGCVWLLQELFKREPGLVNLRVNPAMGRAELVWRVGLGDPRRWMEAAARFGYRFAPSGKSDVSSTRSLLLRLGICTAIAMQVMTFSLAGYFGLDPSSGLFPTVIGWISAVLATASVGIGGWVFLRGAVLGLRARVVHLDLPIALGIVGAYLGSLAAFLIRGAESAYFDTLAIFIALMLAGRWLQERTLVRNRASLNLDTEVDHLRVRRERPEGIEFAPVSQVVPGDTVVWVTGEFLSVSASLLDASALISMEWITGESTPREIAAGERIPAGARLAQGQLARVQVLEPFDASEVHALLTRTRRSPEPEVLGAESAWWSRLSTLYVGAVLVLAAVGLGIGLLSGPEQALRIAVSVLVVTCPCAIGLAVPLARELTQVGLRRRGVFVRADAFLDRASSVSRVVFDKTGTLTEPAASLTETSLDAISRLDAEATAVLYHMVSLSNHPLSRALAQTLPRPLHAPPLAGILITEHPGRGLEARGASVVYRLGSADFAGAHEPGTHFTCNGTHLARLELAERARDDAQHEIAALRDAGFVLHVLSGDEPLRTAAMAKSLGLDPGHVRGGMTPADKEAWMRQHGASDTLFVGDGLNDAPAASAAYLAATPALDHPTLPNRCDFYYLGDGIGAVRRALLGARRYRGVLRTNIALAVIYNLSAVALCYAGWVTPLAAAILMPASSISIVLLTRFRLNPRRETWMSW